MVKVSSRTIKKQGKVSGGTFWLDNHMEAIAEVSGGTIKWIYHFEVKAQVSDGTIRLEYLSKVKQRHQRYQMELSRGHTILL